MDRSSPRRRPWRCLLLMAMILAAAGCKNMMTSMAYLLYGTNVEARYDGLKEKRVAVVCRAPLSMNTHQALGARELAEKIGYVLQQNVQDIEVIDQQKIDDWTDHNSWNEFREIGRALDPPPDRLVAVELDEFSLLDSTSVFRGRATYHITVYDMNEGGKVVYDDQPPQSVYPSNIGVPIGAKRKPDFRRVFVGVLADEIARHFYAHDSMAHFAEDSRSPAID